MTQCKKTMIHKLLKGIETGDPEAVTVVNEDKYIHHNPQPHEGSEGLAALFKRLAKTSPKVNIVRIFEDGEYVFAHTEYDFSSRNIGFEIFRFEDGYAVEHWDNIQKRAEQKGLGCSVIDGVTEVTDHEFTEINRNIIQAFVDNILIQRNIEKSGCYINQEQYTEHNAAFKDILSITNKPLLLRYDKNHRILAEGNFVLSVCEGYSKKVLYSFFDLYRLKDKKIVEHWNTTEKIPSKDKWRNNNGKF
jgi:predicted SnoaL-like aldol condensation-catalyzing enzyme